MLSVHAILQNVIEGLDDDVTGGWAVGTTLWVTEHGYTHYAIRNGSNANSKTIILGNILGICYVRFTDMLAKPFLSPF